MKFQKGDVVTVKGWEEMAAEYQERDMGIATPQHLFSKYMKHLCGKSAVVEEVKEGTYRLRPMEVADLQLDWNWVFTDAMLKEG